MGGSEAQRDYDDRARADCSLSRLTMSGEHRCFGMFHARAWAFAYRMPSGAARRARDAPAGSGGRVVG